MKHQFILPIQSELLIDLFAGGGGASTGIEQATGRHVDIAVNHDPEAVSLHEANHPQTKHFVSDVFEVDPLKVTEGRPVGLLWASPDCKHFSKAKGGKPVSKKIRGLAWVVVKWAKLVRPRIICLENVEEFQTWGPLGDDGRPCAERKGSTFARWKKQLENLGYQIEHKELRACDYGAPTIRKRLFLVARRDGQPIVWPEPTHANPKVEDLRSRKRGEKRLPAWRTAAECIDWSIPAPSIFERSKPLADATCRRIAKGIMRYLVDAKEPFIVNTANTKTTGRGPNHWSGDEPLRTITSSPGFALAVPTLISMGYGERAGQQPRVPGLEHPHSTITAQGQHSALVTAFLAKHYTGVIGSDLRDPTATVTSVDHHSLVTSHMIKLRGDNVGSAATEPLHTVSAQGLHHGEVRAFLVKYYGNDKDGVSLKEPLHTIPTHDRFGLVTIKGEEYAIVDIGLRMLTPRELYRAQGFPESYQIEHGHDGHAITKTAQVRMCGNSVCPPLARAIVQANYAEAQILQRISA